METTYSSPIHLLLLFQRHLQELRLFVCRLVSILPGAAVEAGQLRSGGRWSSMELQSSLEVPTRHVLPRDPWMYSRPCQRLLPQQVPQRSQPPPQQWLPPKCLPVPLLKHRLNIPLQLPLSPPVGARPNSRPVSPHKAPPNPLLDSHPPLPLALRQVSPLGAPPASQPRLPPRFLLLSQARPPLAHQQWHHQEVPLLLPVPRQLASQPRLPLKAPQQSPPHLLLMLRLMNLR
jgi:hypothetical protein